MKNKILLFFLVLIVLGFCGCGAHDKDIKSDMIKNQPEEELYGYQVRENVPEDSADIFCRNGDKLYYAVNGYAADEEGSIQSVCSIYLMDNEEEQQTQKVGELACNIRYMDADEENLYLLKLSYQDECVQQTVCQWSIKEGAVVNEMMLAGDKNGYPMAFERVGDSFFLWSSDAVTVYDGSGAERWSLEQAQSILAACADEDSVIVCVRRFDGVNSNTEFQKLDYMSGKVQKKWESCMEYDIEKAAFKNEKELWIVNSRSGVSIYHMDSDEYEQVVSWMEEGIADIYVREIKEADENNLQLSVTDNGIKKNVFFQVTFGLLEQGNAKKEVIFSIPWMDDGIREAVVQFNKTNQDYRIVVETRQENELYEDYRSNLGRELATGNAADIFLLPPEDYENYREKGLLLNLAPLISGDEEIQREDYFEKTWERYEEGENIYAIPTCFSLETAVSKRDVFSQSGGWTFDEMQNTLKDMPGVTELVSAYSKEDVLKYCCISAAAQNQLNDFESRDFISVLEFANQYGADADKLEENKGQIYHMPDEEHELLMNISVDSVDSISLYRALMNGEVNVVGYPSDAPVPAYMKSGNVMAVRADSECAEGAWEFLKVLLSENIQRKQYHFPVLKTVLEQLVSGTGTDAMESVREGIYIDASFLPVEKPQKEDIVIIKELIEKSVPYPYESEILLNIICEEAAGYFNGQKSVQEAADIIKNRIQLYYLERGI